MSRDPLRVLLRMRSAQVTAARQDLARALAQETAAEQALTDAAAAITRERAGCPPDAALAFAVWLPHARAAQHRAKTQLARDVDQTAQSRAALGERHADAQAVLKLLEKKDAEAARAAGRREQAAMDEAAGRAVRVAAAASPGGVPNNQEGDRKHPR